MEPGLFCLPLWLCEKLCSFSTRAFNGIYIFDSLDDGDDE